MTVPAAIKRRQIDAASYRDSKQRMHQIIYSVLLRDTQDQSPEDLAEQAAKDLSRVFLPLKHQGGTGKRKGGNPL